MKVRNIKQTSAQGQALNTSYYQLAGSCNSKQGIIKPGKTKNSKHFHKVGELIY